LRAGSEKSALLASAEAKKCRLKRESADRILFFLFFREWIRGNIQYSPTRLHDASGQVITEMKVTAMNILKTCT
jgi:hypothetical protein